MTAALLLLEDGVWGLDDAVASFIPEFGAGGKEDVERHRAEAELLARAKAAQEQHVDHHVHHGPRPEDDVDFDLGLGRATRRDVVEERQRDQEKPAKDRRHALADPAAVSVERFIDRLGAELLPKLSVCDYGAKPGRGPYHLRR